MKHYQSEGGYLERRHAYAKELFLEASQLLGMPKSSIEIGELTSDDEDLGSCSATLDTLENGVYRLLIEPSVPESDFPALIMHEAIHTRLTWLKRSHEIVVRNLLKTIRALQNDTEEEAVVRLTEPLVGLLKTKKFPLSESYGKKETSQ